MAKEPQERQDPLEQQPSNPAVPQPPQPEGLTTTGAPIDDRFQHLPPDQRMQKLSHEEEEAAEQRRKSRSERPIGDAQAQDFHPSIQRSEALPEPPQTQTGEPPEKEEDDEKSKSSKKRR